jgi:dephospho-CoA kinase
MEARVFLTGPAGSGKTRLAQALERAGYLRVGLGDLCRQEAMRAGCPLDRRMLQYIGDQIRRAGGGPHALAAEADQMLRAYPRAPAVIDGVRLAAEAEYLRARGYLGVRVDAPEPVRLARLEARGERNDGQHPTETEWAAIPVRWVVLGTADPDRQAGALAAAIARERALRAVPAARRRAAEAAEDYGL